MSLLRILCIDDEPDRYRTLFEHAHLRGIDVAILRDRDAIELFLSRPLPGSRLVGVCLDHDLGAGKPTGLDIARACLVERSVPVAITSCNEPGAANIAGLLESYAVPCVVTPCHRDGWEARALRLFLRRAGVA